MGDFLEFVQNLVWYDYNEVTKTFRPEFLNKPGTWNMIPIHYAVRIGSVEKVNFLINKGCNIEYEDDWGWRPIHYACDNGHVDVLELLVKKGCKLQCKDNNGFTPMQLAQSNNHQNCVAVLNKEVKLQIIRCAKEKQCQPLEELTGADILITEEHETGLTFLELAVQSQAVEVINHLLAQKVYDEEIPLLKRHIENLTSTSRPKAVELILECLLYRSIRFHHADGFELSCLPSVVNDDRKIAPCSFLEAAAEYGASLFINDILKKSDLRKEEWDLAKEKAKQNDFPKILVAISTRESLLASRAKAQFSLLHNAICDNDPDMIRYILDKKRVDKNFRNGVVGTSLGLAYMLCQAECINALEEFKVDKNTQNKYGQSPLHEAIASGMAGHSSYLTKDVRDIDKPGFMGLSGLQCAVIEGYDVLCQKLVKNGADCLRYAEGLLPSYFEETELDLPISTRENAVTFCMKIHGTIYQCFHKSLDPTKVNCSDGNGNTLLHIAVKALLPDLCKLLLEREANVEAINEKGYSPLIELFSNSDNKISDKNFEKVTEIADILIDKYGANITNTPAGTTAFDVAANCNSDRLLGYISKKKVESFKK